MNHPKRIGLILISLITLQLLLMTSSVKAGRYRGFASGNESVAVNFVINCGDTLEFGYAFESGIEEDSPSKAEKITIWVMVGTINEQAVASTPVSFTVPLLSSPVELDVTNYGGDPPSASTINSDYARYAYSPISNSNVVIRWEDLLPSDKLPQVGDKMDIEFMSDSDPNKDNGDYHANNAGKFTFETIGCKPIIVTVDSSNKSMQLTWNVTNDPDVSSYRIQRAVGITGTFEVIVPTVTKTIYFDTDDDSNNNLVEDASYCYKIEALRSSGEVIIASNVACALFGKLDLWIPDTIGKPDDTVIVPINIRNADGLRIGSSDVWMDFNPTVLESVSVSRTVLTANYAWAHSVNAIDATTSRVRIAYIHSDLNNPPPELHGDGSLFWLTFHVKGLPGSTSPLNLNEFISNVGGSSIQDETLADVDLSLTDALLTVEGATNAKYILGDVDADTLVRARDAALALRLANGERQPTRLELLAGDVNGNAAIDTADSSMILHFAAKNEWPQLPKPLVGAASSKELAESATVMLSNGEGKPGENVQLTLSANGLNNIAGGYFVLAYDPRIVQTISDVNKSGLATNFDELAFFADGVGLLHISLSDDSEISGDGTLATITLLLAADAPVGVAPITLAEAKMNDLTGRDFVTNFASNTLIRQSGQITILANSRHNIFLPLVSQ